jgi:hypothetical protein
MGWMTKKITFTEVKDFLFSIASRQALRLTQPPTQWVMGVVLPG